MNMNVVFCCYVIKVNTDIGGISGVFVKQNRPTIRVIFRVGRMLSQMTIE